MEALIRIQKELKAPKGQFNKFGGYKYRSLEDIMEAVKPLLQGAFFTLSYDVVAVLDRVYIKATATLTEGENSVSVTAWARETDTRKGMDAAQVTGSAISYGGKYAASSLFMCADSQGDPDSLPAANAPSEDSKWTPTTGPGQQPASTTTASTGTTTESTPSTGPASPAAAPEGQIPATSIEERPWMKMLWEYYVSISECKLHADSIPAMHKFKELLYVRLGHYPRSMEDIEFVKQTRNPQAAMIKVEELLG